MDFNYFLFYGEAPEGEELEADIVAGLMQDRRSMFYHRGYGAGLSDFENAADGISTQVGLKYRAASYLAERNQEVSDGTGGTRDRRVLVSQGSISVERASGGLDVKLVYVPYADLRSAKVLAVPIGT